MAKDITIWYDGLQRNYNNVEKIQALTADGNTELWVPEDEIHTSGITIYQNGEYLASTQNLYGFTSVIVDIQQATSVTGTKDGVPYTVTLDGSGNLVWTEVTGG